MGSVTNRGASWASFTRLRSSPRPRRNGSASKRHDATVFVTVLPVGWIGDWHENPRPQWIIPLSGRWFVESMDGIRIEIGPGA
jgi:hypothetical protein